MATEDRILKFDRLDHGLVIDSFVHDLDVDALKTTAAQGGYWAYVSASAAAYLEHFQAVTGSIASFGVHIVNYRTSLPMKKGLSSSAAVCVLTLRALSSVFGVELSDAECMELAFRAESCYTPSQCGRMDQCVVMGEGAIALMEFRPDGCSLRRLRNRKALHFVVCDLKAHKDTVVILRDLRACFPHPRNETQSRMLDYVHEIQRLHLDAIDAVESGDVEALGAAMMSAQASFDSNAMPNCPCELTSPVLHSLLLDSEVRRLSIGAKGVGAQGDGSMQMLCATKEDQEALLAYLNRVRGLEAFVLTLPASDSP